MYLHKLCYNYFKLYPLTLLMQSHSVIFLFMYLGEPLQYYQSSNNLPQGAQTNCLCVNLKSRFALLNTSSRSARCWLVSIVSIFLALCCTTPRVTLLILDLSPSFCQSFLLCFAQHLDSLCSLFSCFWQLSKYSYFCRTGSCELLSSLAIESPPANVSFTRAFAVFRPIKAMQ